MFYVKGNPQLDKENFTFSKQFSYPYFTRTVFNNGIYGYVDYYDDKHLVKGNSIAVGMMGMQFFYMAHDFYAGQFTKTVFPKFEGFNWRVALWFISWFNKSSKWYLGLLVRDFEKAFLETEISVPRNHDGSLALNHMESLIREMEESRICEMETYLKVSGFDSCELTEEEIKALDCFDNKRVGTFNIGSLYEKVELQNKTFDKRKDSRPIPDSQYCIPLVNAKHGNNGIMYYGDSNIFDSVEMTIDIVQNGAVATGDVYPQPQRTGVLWDAYLIRASHHQDNVETLIYISTAIAKSIKLKYTYDNKAYWEQVKEELITLPITTSGSIDYQFMETYIRAIEKLTILKVRDWRNREISATKNVVLNDTEPNSLQLHNTPNYYVMYENNLSMMAAEDIFIYGSIPVDLPKTKRSDLIDKRLNLVLMYAIGNPTARQKTESAGKIALGIKDNMLDEEQMAAYRSIKYLMFHYWSNPKAYQLTKEAILVNRESVPSDYLVRQEKDATKFLLLEYNPQQPAELEGINILKTQRKGEIRYLPFVTTLTSIQNDK